jgi:DNA-binding protein HU-beta
MAAKKTAKKATDPADGAKPAKKAAKKAPAKKAAKKAANSAPAAPEKKKSPPPPDAIARGAYLNYRRRVEHGLPGDSHGDWLEAERQLREAD